MCDFTEFGACYSRPGDRECRSPVSCAGQGQGASSEGKPVIAILRRTALTLCVYCLQEELIQSLQSSEREKEAELTRAEETIRREQQQSQEMRQQMSQKVNHQPCM